MNSIELTTIYDPFTNCYKIKAGEHVLEVPAHLLTQEHIEDLVAALKSLDDDDKIKATLEAFEKAIINSNGDSSAWTVEHCGKPRCPSKSSELIIDDVIKSERFIPANIEVLDPNNIAITVSESTTGHVVLQASYEVPDDGSDVITNVSEVPYENPVYSNINSVGRQWIFRYALALV